MGGKDEAGGGIKVEPGDGGGEKGGGRTTIFSEDGIYRYTLWREWPGGSGYVNFIMLNPSTADAERNDPTIRRCIDFAQRWGYQALCVTNIFGYRSTNKAVLKKLEAPIGDANDDHLIEIAGAADLIICAWSSEARLGGREAVIWDILPKPVYALRISKVTGCPYHPLYLPANSTPIVYERPEWVLTK